MMTTTANQIPESFWRKKIRCKTCNKEIERHPFQAGQPVKYCSDECRVRYARHHRRIAKNQVEQPAFFPSIGRQNWFFACVSCGAELRNRRKYCSPRCKQKAYRQRNEKNTYWDSYDRITPGVEKINRLKETEYTFGELIRDE